jgi:hypothetical protein
MMTYNVVDEGLKAVKDGKLTISDFNSQLEEVAKVNGLTRTIGFKRAYVIGLGFSLSVLTIYGGLYFIMNIVNGFLKGSY